MSVIKILPDKVSNQIAAGEVIARPASVVKELLENALDAGATEITVKIEKGGDKLISVTDNGRGMDSDDAMLCLEAHATSKIHEEKDIVSISSFGFRGEALPSIASVSRLTIRTRIRDRLEGAEVVVNGSKFISSQPVGCAPGTEIVVRDLFFNTPARKKFLKSISTEEKHIQETLYSLALPYPQVSFNLYLDGREALSSPPAADFRPRLKAIFGKGFEQAMLPLGYHESGIKISGFIAKHGFTKSSRREQRFFVNGRPVEAASAYRGVREGYSTLVAKGRFPPVIIFIGIDPALVDVNVHPAKKEVRFRQDRLVANVISQALRATLRNTFSKVESSALEMPLNSLLEAADISYNPKGSDTANLDLGLGSVVVDMPPPPLPRTSQPSIDPPIPAPAPVAPARPATQVISPRPEESTPVEEKTQLGFPTVDSITILGFLDNSYLVIAAETGLLIIDQHAAHERILYERLLNNRSSEILSQRLLLPITIELSRAEKIFIEKHGDLFYNLGFEIEPFGQNTILVHAIPEALPQDNIGGFLSDLLCEMLEKEEVTKKVDEAVIARAACAAAVKSHDALTIKEAESLIQQMGECELPFSCPHGRPTIINISRKELEKRFGRT